MTRRVVGAAAVAAAALATLGGATCFFPEGERPGGYVPEEEAGAGGGAGSSSEGGAAPVLVEVQLVNLSFNPRQVEVASGGEVRFVNQDPTAHIIRDGSPEMPGTLFRRRPLPTGESVTFKVGGPGEITFFCDNHPQMMRDGRIRVR